MAKLFRVLCVVSYFPNISCSSDFYLYIVLNHKIIEKTLLSDDNS